MQLIINLLPYLIVVNMLGLIITVYDKFAARSDLWRVPENILFLVAIIGGSFFMCITMQIIRHKTRNKKFVYGLPLIVVIHITISMIYLFSTINMVG